MEILNNISDLLQRGQAKEIKVRVQEALDNGVEPKDILTKGLIAGMSIIGQKFKNNEVFVPEVLIAARAMNFALEILKPALIKSGVKPVGRAIVCTVKGDMHDIGKNLVKMMIEGQGIEVIDIGVDVDGAQMVKAIIDYKPQVVCLSALLSTTMASQKEIISAIIAAGLRNTVKIIVGGAPITESFSKEIGADGYSEDAAGAATLARSYFG